MNRRNFLKLSLASATAAMVPSVLTQAIATVTPAEYKGWKCIVSDRTWDGILRKQVYWTGLVGGKEYHRAILFDNEETISKVIEQSMAGLGISIRRLKRRIA